MHILYTFAIQSDSLDVNRHTHIYTDFPFHESCWDSLLNGGYSIYPPL